MTARPVLHIARRIGLTGLVVFTFGVLLGPLAHNVGHRADHVHRDGHFAAALHVLRGQFDSHERAHALGHAHSHAPSPRRDEGRGNERRGSDPHHGEGSLAHFAAAVLAPALFVVPPLATAAESLAPPSLESVCDGRPPRRPIQPRAPPS